MSITYYNDLIQGSDDWHAARCGLLTASEMSLIITPATLKVASNDKERTHLYELLAQRITGYVEPAYISDNMLRGWENEILSRELYSEKYAPVTEVGFVTNDEWGFTLGYSPDGLVGDEGTVEFKSRLQKYQIQTIVEDEVPKDFIIQIQTGLAVTKRLWCDFGSYSGGLPFFVKRVYADQAIQDAIIAAAREFENRLRVKQASYQITAANFWPTERKLDEEIVA